MTSLLSDNCTFYTIDYCYQIAIVRQTETALSRKRKRAQGAPATAAQPFNRDVVAVFTPGTGISADHPCVSDLLRSESNDSCRCISAVDTDVLQGANMETDEATWVVAVHEERVDRQPFYSYGVVAVSLDHCLLRHQYLEGDLNLTRLTHLLDIIKVVLNVE